MTTTEAEMRTAWRDDAGQTRGRVRFAGPGGEPAVTLVYDAAVLIEVRVHPDWAMTFAPDGGAVFTYAGPADWGAA